MKDHYLGDGLYVNDDGCQIELSTERNSGVHFVCLDDSVLTAFLDFLCKSRGLSIQINKLDQPDEVPKYISDCPA